MDEKKSFEKTFYQKLEEGIERLSSVERGNLYRPCAENCVKNTVLPELKRQFDECDGDLDLQYTRYGRSEYFFADIAEPGHVYEMGYPRCVCPMVNSGLAASPVHCECSRQSILYVLETLMPGKTIQVETMHTVLSDATECRFRVTVD